MSRITMNNHYELMGRVPSKPRERMLDFLAAGKLSIDRDDRLKEYNRVTAEGIKEGEPLYANCRPVAAAYVITIVFQNYLEFNDKFDDLIKAYGGIEELEMFTEDELNDSF